MPSTLPQPAHADNRAEYLFVNGLTVLTVIAAWLFVPQLADAFAIKHVVTAIGLLLLALIFLSQVTPPWRLPGGLVGAGALIWLSAVIVSAAAADNGRLAAMDLGKLAPFVVLVVCLFNVRDQDAARSRIEMGLLVAAGGIAIFGLKQWLFPEFLDPGFHAPGKMRIYSTLGNANLAALVLLPALPLALFRCVRSGGSARIAYAGLVALLATGLVVTQARQALFAVAVMVFLALVWLVPGPRMRIAAVVVGLVVGVTAVVLTFVSFPESLVHSAKGRWFIWMSGLHMMWQHPLTGIGPGHFGLNHTDAQAALYATGAFGAFLDNAAVVKDAHNDFIHWGASAGIAGFAGFALLCLATLRQGWRSPELRQHHPQLLLALAGFAAAMLFTSALVHAATALVFWLLIGLVLRHGPTPAVESKPGRVGRYAVCGSIALALGASAIFGYLEIRAQRDQAEGNKLMEQRDLWLAGKKYRDALAWSRTDGERLKLHASALFLAGQPRGALAALGEARRYSGDIGIYILEAEILTRLGDYERAIQIYGRLIAAFPKMITPRFVLGQIYALRGEHALAESEFMQVVAIQPSPFNLNMTGEKVEMQKEIARRYLLERPGG